MRICHGRSAIALWVSAAVIVSISEADSQLQDDDFIIASEAVSGKLYQVPLTGNSKPLEVRLRPQAAPSAVDYDPLSGKVYWTDQDNAVIKSAVLLDGSSERIIKQLPLEARPGGLAVDPVARLIFYTRRGTQPGLAVMDVDGLAHRVLISGNEKGMQKPKSVALDTNNRHVYWLDSGKIYRANYDGTSQTAIITSGATLDFALNLNSSSDSRIIWLDGTENKVSEATLAGTSTKTVVTYDSTYQTTSLAIDGSDVYFSRSSSGTNSSILRYSRTEGQTAEYGKITSLTFNDMVIYRSSNYINGTKSDCSVDNGNCSHLCLPTTTRRVCACPEYLKLSSDNITCIIGNIVEVLGKGPEMVWLEYTGISSRIRGISGETRIRLKSRSLSTWVLTLRYRRVQAIVGWSANNSIIYSEGVYRSIYMRYFNDPGTAYTIYTGTSSNVKGMAVDWLAGNIYWTDASYNFVAMSKIEREAKHFRVLANTGVDEPFGIAVYPQKGLLFWSDIGTVPKIEVSSLSGKNRRVFIYKNVYNPKGLTIDYDSDRLLWADGNAIKSVEIDAPDNIKVITRVSGRSFYGLDLSYGYLYATDTASSDGRNRVYFFDTTKASDLHLKTPWYSAKDITMVRPERQPLTESPCRINNFGCAHLCVSAASGAECVCSDGFYLDQDGKNCKQFPSFNIYYSTGGQLCRVSTVTTTGGGSGKSCFFSSSQFKWTALSYDYRARHLIFTDTKYRVATIRSVPVNYLKNNTVLVYGTGKVKGVALDWINGNLYWTDADLKQVWVSRRDGSFSRILIRNMQDPHGILVDPKRSKIFWSDKGTRPALYQAYMDGKGMSVFYNKSDIGSPGGMTIDRKNDRLFYVDELNNRIMSLSLSGSDTNAKIEYSPRDHKIYHLDIYQDYIIFTSNGNHSGVHKVKNGKLVRSWGAREAYDVVVFDQTNQNLNHTGNCSYNFGGCEQLCLPNPTSSNLCACSDGLVPSGKNCVSGKILKDNFMLVADDYRHAIYQLSLDDLAKEPIKAVTVKIPREERPIGLDYDTVEQRVYWSDFNYGIIKRSFLNGSGLEIIFELPTDARVDGITIDHISRLLYYADSKRNLIGVMTLTGKNHKTILTYENGGVYNPRSIVLDLVSGFIYWTNRGSKAAIMRANLNGAESTVLLSQSLQFPNGLYIDYTSGFLYWCDGHTERIERAMLNDVTGSRKLIYNVSSLGDPFSVAVYGQHVYWTDWYFRGLSRVQLNGNQPETFHKDFFTGLNEIRIIQSRAIDNERKASSSKCKDKNGNCSHLCFTTPLHIDCGCPDGVMRKDNFNCEGVNTCPSTIPNGRISNSSCHARAGAECHFVCDDKFRATSSKPMTCGYDHQWESPDGSLSSLCVDNTCAILLTPKNATELKLCVVGASVGETCTHACNQGFQPVGGDKVRTCQQNLTWSGQDLKCTEITPSPSPTTATTTTLLPTTTRSPLTETSTMKATSQPTTMSQTIRSQTTTAQTTMAQTTVPQTTSTQPTTSVTINGTEGNPGRYSGKPNGSSGKKATIIGAVCGVLALIAIIVIIAMVFYWRRGKSKGQYRESMNMPTGEPPLDVNVNSIPKPIPQSTSYDVASGRVNMAFENPTYANPAEVRAEAAGMKNPLGPDGIDFSITDGKEGFVNPHYFTRKENPFAKPNTSRSDSMTEPLYESFPGDAIDSPLDQAVALDPGMTVLGTKA